LWVKSICFGIIFKEFLPIFSVSPLSYHQTLAIGTEFERE
jgi:hypothetical protein